MSGTLTVVPSSGDPPRPALRCATPPIMEFFSGSVPDPFTSPLLRRVYIRGRDHEGLVPAPPEAGRTTQYALLTLSMEPYRWAA